MYCPIPAPEGWLVIDQSIKLYSLYGFRKIISLFFIDGARMIIPYI